MKSKQAVIGILGLVIGFILGFFVSEAVQRTGGQSVQGQSTPSPAVSAQAPPAQGGGSLPEGHPPADVMEKVRQLESQAQEHPEDKEVRIALGNWYYDVGRFDGAIRWYEEALQLDPQNVNVRTDLGTSYLYTGNPQKAIETYRQSLSLDADHPQTLQNLGFAYFAVEDFKNAIQTWETLLAKHSSYPHADKIREQIQNARERSQENRS